VDSLPGESSPSISLADPPLSDEFVAASQPFVGRWNKLVS
jgi:hypothetical protein